MMSETTKTTRNTKNRILAANIHSFAGNGGKPEESGDQSDDQEKNGPAKHGKPPVVMRLLPSS